MNKEFFLRELEYLLSDLSEEEREAALEYYTDYFEEADPEHEEEMARRLGSPAKAAAELKAGLAGEADSGAFTERGYYDERFEEDSQIPDQYTEVVAGEVIDEEEEYKEKKGSGRTRRRASHTAERSSWDEEWSERKDAHQMRQRRTAQKSSGLLLLILFLVFGLPLAGTIFGAGFSVIAALIGVVFGILGGLIGLIAGGVASIFGLFAAGIGTIIAGFCNFSTPALGTMAVGAGFFMITGALLFLIAVKWAVGIAVPGVIRLSIDLVQKTVGMVKRLIGRMFGRRGEDR